MVITQQRKTVRETKMISEYSVKKLTTKGNVSKLHLIVLIFLIIYTGGVNTNLSSNTQNYDILSKEYN